MGAPKKSYGVGPGPNPNLNGEQFVDQPGAARRYRSTSEHRETLGYMGVKYDFIPPPGSGRVSYKKGEGLDFSGVARKWPPEYIGEPDIATTAERQIGKERESTPMYAELRHQMRTRPHRYGRN